MSRSPGRPLVWIALTLPLAALSVVAYYVSEWLFFVTKPSTLSALPLTTELGVLSHAALPLLWWLSAVQAVASVVSTIAFPRVRALAVVPASMVGGALLFVLLDNFTYTVFGFGALTSDGVWRVAYAAVLPVFVVVAAQRLLQWVDAAASVARATPFALATAAAIAVVPAVVPQSTAPPDLAAPPATSTGARSTRPNILIVGIDGVDATSLSAYGYERDTSPYLAQLREESLLFENAFSNVGRTHGSLVALLTGRLPFSTRVTFPPTALVGDDARRHLPGLLKPLGYTSLQLGMRHYADAEDANLLGFDAANYRWQSVEDVRRTSAIDEAAVFRSDVAERIDERIGHLFGWRHAVDVYAHVEGTQESPYWKDARRVETLTRYLPVAPEPFLVHTHLLDTHCCSYHPKTVVFSGTNRTRDALDSQLREADHNVRAVVESLRASGRLERTIVVITSDHTNGWTTKGRVPLLIRFPGRQLTGRVHENVQLADVVPTLLDYLDVPIPDWVDGVSLIDEAARGQRPIFGVSDVAEYHTVGVMVKALDHAGPPNYGAGSVTMISGSDWFELDLDDGHLETGPVPGHTRPEAPGLGLAAAESLMRSRIRAAGFEVGSKGNE